MSDNRSKRDSMSLEEATVSNMWGIAAIVEVLEVSCSNALLNGRIGVSLNAYGRSRPVRADVSHSVKRLMANIKDSKQVMIIRLDY